MRFLKVTPLLVIFLFGSAFVPEKQSFEEIQKNFTRVKDVYERKEELIKMKCRSLDIPEETFGNMFIRVFKMECIMEVWVQRPDGKYIKFKQFDIYALSGLLGPKRMQGDRQVPEGFYYISEFNPTSNYYLSLGINYPNESDLKSSGADRKGGDIFIHGAQCSAGCMAMSNYYIEDIYMCAVKAHSNGQERIPVEIFPFKMTPQNLAYYQKFEPYKKYGMFWGDLMKGYQFFEKTNRIPDVVVDETGRYSFIDPRSVQALKEAN
jgi:murein L,D-transpeptidase YafK